jgi:hypothetical protein
VTLIVGAVFPVMFVQYQISAGTEFVPTLAMARVKLFVPSLTLFTATFPPAADRTIRAFPVVVFEFSLTLCVNEVLPDHAPFSWTNAGAAVASKQKVPKTNSNRNSNKLWWAQHR